MYDCCCCKIYIYSEMSGALGDLKRAFCERETQDKIKNEQQMHYYLGEQSL